MRRILMLLLVVPALALAGCGSDDSDDSAGSAESAEQSQYAGNGVTVTGEPDAEPTISIDTAAEPPAELTVETITEGDGKEIGANSLVSVQYVGSTWSDGQVFQSSWADGPLEFPIAGVIPGWQQGLQGVPEGSRVLLIIPPELAYGSNPPPGSGIEADETLVFVVDVVEVQS
jgi:FKBP-type peptidyl-prolyl cis-trans isomerase